MLKYLLDTNIVSEPARPAPSERVVRKLREHAAEIALPSVVWHELVYGVERMEEGNRKSYLTSYLTEVVAPSMPVLPYDMAAAQWHGQRRADLEAEGRPIPFADGQIAAIGGTRDLIVATQNTSDFESLFGGLSTACDFVDLVQNGFCTRPVALLQGSLEHRSCTSPTVSRLRIHPQNRL